MNHKGVEKITDFGFPKIVDNFNGELLRICIVVHHYISHHKH
ncbi:unnamed protein product [Paramecium sonneborni]|uniref:Uncharacterized protein n=1 Tax=Paramecium sonneborni TaxID=65129 RepID=A0A8S1RHS0_9CILI|nr:unnamed protein product [Paramecium sonneborni]